MEEAMTTRTIELLREAVSPEEYEPGLPLVWDGGRGIYLADDGWYDGPIARVYQYPCSFTSVMMYQASVTPDLSTPFGMDWARRLLSTRLGWPGWVRREGLSWGPVQWLDSDEDDAPEGTENGDHRGWELRNIFRVDGDVEGNSAVFAIATLDDAEAIAQALLETKPKDHTARNWVCRIPGGQIRIDVQT